MTRAAPCLLLVTFAAVAAHAAAPPVGPDRLPWTEIETGEQDLVSTMLDAPDWPFRVFGLLRLDRYDGVEELVRARLADEA
ncbi:MAG: hypothetical protein ACYTGG_02240, partial [Planctomycetota bacterium]